MKSARLRPRRKPEENNQTSLRGVLDTVGAIIAPATLVTGLGLYIGWRRTDSYTQYLGIDETLLQYSAQDYLLRSWQSAGEVVFTLVLGAVIAAVAHSAIRAFLPRGTVLALAGTVFSLSALILLGMFVSSVAPPVDRWLSDLIYDIPYLTEYAITAFAVALLTYAVLLIWDVHTKPLTSLVAILLFLGVISATDKWVTLLGEKDAAYMTTTLGQRQGVIVYSKGDLNLPSVVTCKEFTDPHMVYRFRCEGLRLYIRAADKYFLLPTKWSRADSEAEPDRMIVLRDDPSLRFEFTPG